jgi:hypothetical protein
MGDYNNFNRRCYLKIAVFDYLKKRGQVERGQVERGQVERGQVERGQVERGQLASNIKFNRRYYLKIVVFDC